MKPLSARQMERIARHLGWYEVGQTGSHRKFRDCISGKSIPIPMHAGDLPQGTQRTIMRALGITPEELPRLLKEI